MIDAARHPQPRFSALDKPKDESRSPSQPLKGLPFFFFFNKSIFQIDGDMLYCLSLEMAHANTGSFTSVWPEASRRNISATDDI